VRDPASLSAEREALASPFTYGVVIPTIATPEVLIPTLRRLVSHLPTDEGVIIALCLNPVPANLARIREVESELEALSQALEGTPHDLVWMNEGKATGFGLASNRAIQIMLDRAGLPDLTVIFNDDLRVTPGWLQGLKKAASTTFVRLVSEPPSEAPDDGRVLQQVGGKDVGVRPRRPLEGYGRIGIVGPCSVNVAGIQSVSAEAQITEKNADHFSSLFRRDNSGEYLSASFLSGFCMALTAECLLDLSYRGEDGKVIGVFDGERYPVAGYEDNDLCVRAERQGWRLLVDGETFIFHLGHQSFDKFFPGMDRGMRNRLAYYEKHRAESRNGPTQKVVAVYRVKVETGNDIGYLRASMVGMSRLVDGFAILLTENPAECSRSPDFRACLPSFGDHDRAWLQACVDATKEKGGGLKAVAEATRRWVIQTLRLQAKDQGGREVPVKVRCWEGDFNEREERNGVIALGESMGADWLWSVDHDELPEERVRRAHLDRWLSHPDPMVQEWDFSWLNHWDSERMIRVDSPWGDAVNGRPTYRGGMHGFRLWKVNKAFPRRIQAGGFNGLHCGNCPEMGPQAKRVAGFRFRHLGYLRHFDRVRKLRRYGEQDPNPDPWLVGADGYGHLVQEEGAVFYPYVEVNGMGLHVLVYEKEDPDDLGRLLDYLYGVVDAVVLTWTGEWAEGDRGWTSDPEAPWSLEEWPSTGPSRELAKYASLFRARFIHHPLADNIAEARNAGIRELARIGKEELPGIGWSLFIDPDEHFQAPHEEMVALRRMAEVSNGWGWLFRYHNLQPAGPPTSSESVRLSRIDPEGLMVMNGRVHEGFDHATQALLARGEHPQLRYSPFVLLNAGQKVSDLRMEQKLDHYIHLLRLELADDPYSAKAWVSLGLHAENQGDENTAMECYRRAMLCPGNSYLPFKEAGFYHLRMARIMVSEVVARTAGSHGYHRIAQEMLAWLQENAPERPLVGMARVDGSSRKGLSFDLPDFPDPTIPPAVPTDPGEPVAEPTPPGE
jgi:GT2 family glycosyltransferase